MTDPVASIQSALADRYTIERELGRGGMATVYLARDLRHERFVALKVLRSDLGAALGPERFNREIKVAAGLQHPHIVSVHDSGTTLDGQLWFTMPYIEGESLRARLEREKQLPIEDALQIAREVADALQDAHQHGIVHRDIKPENILLSRGHAMVADFGVARAVDGGGTGRQPLTETGMALGTPTYMSPEQAAGERALDARTDVYALGCVLYEMLSGEPPYTGATAQVILAKRVTGEVPSVRRLRSAVPASVDAALTKALAPAPADRFSSAAAFARVLEGAASQPVTGESQSRRLATVGAVAIVLLLGAGVVVARRRAGAGAPATASSSLVRLAVIPFDNLGDSSDAYFADGVTDAVRGKLTSLSGLEVIGSNSSDQYRRTTKTPQQIGQELGVRYLLVGKVRWAKGGQGGTPSRVQVSPELIDASNAADKWEQPFDAPLTDVFQVQADIANKVAQQLQVTLNPSGRQVLGQRPTANLDAYDAYLHARQAERTGHSAGAARRGAALYAEAVRLDSGFALAWVGLSQAHAAMFVVGVPTATDADVARAAAERALTLAPNLPEAYDAEASYYAVVRDDYAKALAIAQAGLKISPNNPALLRGAGYAQISRGRWDEAIALTERAARVDPRNGGTAIDLGREYLYLRRYAEARTALDHAIVLEPGNLDAFTFRAMVELAAGDLPRARAIVRAAANTIDPAEIVAFLAQRRDLAWVLDSGQQQVLRALPPSAFDDDRANWGLVVAEAYALRGDPVHTRAYADSARVACEAQLLTAPSQPTLHALHGLILAYLGRRAEAVAEGERAVAMVPMSLDGFSGPGYQFRLMRIYILVGEPDKALDRLDVLLKLPFYLSPAWLRIDPRFDTLRGHPRFDRLVAADVAHGPAESDSQTPTGPRRE